MVPLRDFITFLTNNLYLLGTYDTYLANTGCYINPNNRFNPEETIITVFDEDYEDEREIKDFVLDRSANNTGCLSASIIENAFDFRNHASKTNITKLYSSTLHQGLFTTVNINTYNESHYLYFLVDDDYVYLGNLYGGSDHSCFTITPKDEFINLFNLMISTNDNILYGKLFNKLTGFNTLYRDDPKENVENVSISSLKINSTDDLLIKLLDYLDEMVYPFLQSRDVENEINQYNDLIVLINTMLEDIEF